MSLLGQMFVVFFAVLAVCEDIPLCEDAEPYEMWCDSFSGDCQLGQETELNCTVFPSKFCEGPRSFNKTITNCRYCYQVSDYECENVTSCEPGMKEVSANCKSLTPCIGPSIFQRRSVCKRSSKSQKTAILLSLFLGGFAADRYYLGHYVTAVFKMLTFGGFGFAYFIDLLLICFGYLGPADGSLYPERL